MSNNIDDIFKKGIGNIDFPQREQMWVHLESQLNKTATHRRRRNYSYLLLLLCFVLGIVFLSNNLIHKNNIVVGSNKKTTAAKVFAPTIVFSKRHTIGKPDNNNGNKQNSDKASQSNPIAKSSSKKVKQSQCMNAQTTSTLQQFTTNETEPSMELPTIGVTKNSEQFKLIPYASALKEKVCIVAIATAVSLSPIKIVLPPVQSKYTLQAVAGSDIFNLKKGAGYYAGIKVNKSYSKGMSLSIGINYSTSFLAESYRRSGKPNQEQEADAEINKLVMLRFPLSIEQQIGKSKFTGVAGLVPIYILDAAILNKPPAVGANPDNYRQFKIADIKRLNVLFSAGLRYNVLQRLAVDITGSYGLTEMVKNSYINQSSTNGNFKNIQLGLVFLIK